MIGGGGSHPVHAQGTKDNGARYSVGVERRGNACLVRINGETVTGSQTSPEAFRLQIVGPNSYQILDRGPSFRVACWIGACSTWNTLTRIGTADYDRCLRQRNAALRAGDRDFWIWDRELARTADRISYWRDKNTVRASAANFQRLTEDLEGFSNVMFRYGQGWALGKGWPSA